MHTSIRIRTAAWAVLTATTTVVGLATPAAVARPAAASVVSAPASTTSDSSALTAPQRAVLRGIAKDTWRFFESDVDHNTHLPLDNLGPGSVRGNYTSAANVGVYLWSVVAAHDLKLISTRKAVALLNATLATVSKMKRSHGFLYQWYNTTDASEIQDPATGLECSTDTTPALNDNCFFLSAVDNGWYASGLVVARQAFPQVRLATRLLRSMDFSIFYDNRPQTGCNVNSSLPGSPATGHQYGGYYVGVGPAPYHSDVLYSDPRIATYLGLGLNQMPGDVWWTTWRTLPPQRCSTDPDFSFQGQTPGGYWKTVRDPRSGKAFHVWEGHYTYPGTAEKFIPTYNGGMFEGLMANEVVPETSWGKSSLGLADRRLVDVQIKYATEQLHYPVWGISPSSTADDTGGYGGFGAQGLTFPVGQRLAQGPCVVSSTNDCSNVENTVTPHASFLALDVAPQRAFANITRLRTLYPSLYSHDGGFNDAVNPATGQVGHRRLVLDQSMIMAALDNALNQRRMQRWFAADPVSGAARLYLGAETMSLR